MSAEASTMTKPDDPAAHLVHMPQDRRDAAKAHIATVTATVRKVAMDVPLTADIEDFRRVLAAHAPKGSRS
jgi:hypothetical protein